MGVIRCFLLFIFLLPLFHQRTASRSASMRVESAPVASDSSDARTEFTGDGRAGVWKMVLRQSEGGKHLEEEEEAGLELETEQMVN